MLKLLWDRNSISSYFLPNISHFLLIIIIISQVARLPQIRSLTRELLLDIIEALANDMNEARLCQDLSNPWTILSSPSFGVHASTPRHTLSKLPAAYSDLHYVGQYFQVEFLTIIGIPNGVHWIDWVIHIKKNK